MNRLFEYWHQKRFGFWFILLMNLWLLGEYLYSPDSAKAIVFIFWIQSIFLGIENIFKILFSERGEIIEVNGVPQRTTFVSNFFAAMFFMVHFGIFILVFGGIAVASKSIPGSFFQPWVYPAILAIVAGTVIDLPFKLVAVHKHSPGFSSLMFLPYIRLVPFLLVFVSTFNTIFWVYPLFLLLKTGAELIYYFFVDRPLLRQ